MTSSSLVPFTVGEVTDLPKCYDFEDDTFWQVPFTYRITGLLFGGFLLMFGLMGNMLLVIAYIKYKTIQTPFNTILVGMSCIDLLYLTCVLPVLLSVYVRGTWIPFYTSSGDVDILCVCISNIFTYNQVTSMLHVFIIGFYRHAVVVHPFGKLERINKSRRLVIMMISAVHLGIFFGWVVPMIINFSKVNKKAGEGLMFTSAFDTRRMICGIPCSASAINVLMTSGAWTIIVALCIMYARILMATRRSRRVREISNQSSSKGNTSQTKEIRFILTVSILLIVCIVCYTALPLLSRISKGSSFSHSLFFPFVVLNWIPPSCNWLLYTALAKDFNGAYKRLLFSKFYSVQDAERGKSQMKTTVINVREIQLRD